MTVVPASFFAKGAEWSVGRATDAAGGLSGAAGSGGTGFADQLQKLQDMQDQASHASRALADGTATDPSSVVLAVERARLAMQLAAQLRTKGVEAINEIFHTQV